MPTNVKIAIIGAGSAQFSGEVTRDLCVTPGLHGSHVVLMDVDQQRLDTVYRLAQRVSDEFNAGLSFSCTTERAGALQGADFVINTAQVGGHDWSEAQRRMAERHGYYRGTHLSGFGQMAFFLDVARDVERICPNAWLIQSANPVFEGCTLMHRETKAKVLGLCHGHLSYRHIAYVLGLDLEHVSAQSPGFNHWIWMTDFRYRGKDAYPLLDRWLETEAESFWAMDDAALGDSQVSPDVARQYGFYGPMALKTAVLTNMSRAAFQGYKLFGLMPIGDTARAVGWWHHSNLAAKQRWYGRIGGFDSEIGWQLYLDMLNENLQKVEQAVTDKSTPIRGIFEPKQSDEQIVPIIDSLVNDVERLFQVNIPNRGQIIQGFPEDLVIECQGVVSGAGIRGVAAPPFPAKLMAGAMIPRWHRAELMVNALRTGDWEMLLLYLLEDHRTRSLEQAEGLLAEWLADARNEQVARLFGQS